VIITGASSGIGRSLAIELAKRKARLSLAARNQPALEDLKAEIKSHGVDVMECPTDVSKEHDCQVLIERTLEHFGRIDILIVNAGISMRAILEELDLSVFDTVMKVNLWGAVYCTKYALPHLLKAKGSVVGVSSIGGYVGLPARTAYCASKSALQGFMDSLRTENLKTGLHVLVVCPNYTESNIRKQALNAKGEHQDESPINEGSVMSSQEVAIIIANAIEKRKRRVTLTFEGKLIVFLSKFFPSIIEKIAFKRITAEPGSPIKLE